MANTLGMLVQLDFAQAPSQPTGQQGGRPETIQPAPDQEPPMVSGIPR